MTLAIEFKCLGNNGNMRKCGKHGGFTSYFQGLKNEPQCNLYGNFVLPTRKKIIANEHCTHCQASRADTQTNSSQRVQFCFSPH